MNVFKKGFLNKALSLLVVLSFMLTMLCSVLTVSAADKGAWAPNTAYNVGDTVSYDGSGYTCILAHTSLNGWEPPNVPALWDAGGVVISTVATPAFNPAGGTYSAAQNVAITCTTSGAAIRYTTDGSEPTSSSAEYTGTITVSATTTIKAKAFKSGMNDSSTATAAYTIDSSRVATPVLSPAGGNYSSAQNVTIACATSGVDIRYTTDGSEPIASSTQYTGAIPVTSGTVTIKARAFKSGMTDSATSSATYTISTAQAANWTGKWIWQSADGPNNTFISFRKTVNLTAKPSSAIANIAAENEYWLYVNGNLVVKEGGLQCRPDFTNTYYDQIDISSYLQSGSNTIAALVWYKGGNNGYTQVMASKGGFFFECNVTGATPAKIVSDNSWKMKVNPAFNATTQLANPTDGSYKWVAYPISYDARNEISGWYQTTYDDSAWSYATDKGVPPTAPWNDLKPRTIPLWRDYALSSYTNLSFPKTISGNTTVEGTVGTNIQGTQYMKINAPAGVKVKMYMNDFYYVEYYTKAGEQEFDTMSWQNASNHYARYEFSNIPSGQTVQILDLKFHQSSYDTSIIGAFNSNDSRLNTLWTKAKNTSYVCMRDYFMDCPNRERGQWWGDVSEQILFSFYLYDTNANLLAKKGFRELFNCQKPDGSLYTTAPGNAFNLPDQNLAAAISLWDYYMYTGDSALITELYPRVKKFVDNFASFRNSDGMVLQQTGPWNWIDWGSNMDNQNGSANTVVNALFINLLTAAKNMATVSGNTADIPYYQGLQDAVKSKFNTYFWSSSKNAYVYNWKNGVQSSCSDDRSNAWAVLSGMVDSAKIPGVLNVLTSQYDCSPYQERYVEDALFMLGADSQALGRMRNRHKDMINSWSSTLWEEYPANNSNNHAWSCGPLYLLDAYALGIKPASAGYTQFKYEPHLGGLTSISATIPSVKGNITASITSTSSQYTQNLNAPSNTTAVVSIPKNAFASSFGLINTIKIGSTVIYQNGAYSGGVSGVSFNSEDSSYIRFNVNSGNWSFVATSKLQTLTTVISDNFDDNSIDTAKWNVINKGLESTGESGIAAQEIGSQISLNGTSSVNYWGGKTLQSKSTFTATAANPLSFEVDRVSVSGSGIYRSSIWLWKSPTEYVHIGQDIGERNWAYNKDGETGEGTQIWNDSNTGLRKVKLIHDGSNVYVFIDGTQYAAIPVAWSSGFRVMFTGQARASGNTVTAIFDNFAVKTPVGSASGPMGYNYCADENGTFTLNGAYDVAFGANGLFSYKYGQTGTTTFNNATFGDPIPGVTKKGYYKVSDAPAGYAFCANENGMYTLSGICDVAYGANGQFKYKYGQTGTITFNNATFGDPIPGVAKKGYYKPVGATFFADADYGGTSVTLAKGNYTRAQLIAAGLPDDYLSSLKVPNGWTVDLYQNDNFTGTKWTFTEDSTYIGKSANDQTTSIMIY